MQAHARMAREPRAIAGFRQTSDPTCICTSGASCHSKVYSAAMDTFGMIIPCPRPCGAEHLSLSR
ncbi:hypothetical protein K437DRAFT_36872 [Tilletiaria anomala UBC 951]|uniref:Uncharacterized protein n=1 Tax=Tilletiaria anomala (strain ATCC 24038 / CBS 436.72 / UBC 951) TaxID=1037660 RepID=A0A066V7E7_TILAU|nr:uncharacterized protein K437DRAFT_36872 [Tilletiaria anomala UBC 951]KDN37667.1 hypothetical protein K437DRAFT_36872 [Tilletiaria anomala UBC 951]